VGTDLPDRYEIGSKDERGVKKQDLPLSARASNSVPPFRSHIVVRDDMPEAYSHGHHFSGLDSQGLRHLVNAIGEAWILCQYSCGFGTPVSSLSRPEARSSQAFRRAHLKPIYE